MATDAQNEHRARLRIIHQFLHAGRHCLEVEQRFLDLVAQDDLAVEVLVNVVKLAPGEVENRLYVEHSQLEVVPVEQIGHVSDEKLACLQLRGESGLCTDLTQLQHRTGWEAN